MSDEFNPRWVKTAKPTKAKPVGKKAKPTGLADLVAGHDAKQITNLLRVGEITPSQEFSFDDSKQHTLLPVAIERGWNSLAIELIQCGANVNRFSVSCTPLMLACSDRDHASNEVIEALLKAGAKLELRTKRIEDGGDETALMLAASNRYLWAVKRLIAAGADVKAKTKAGKTAIHYALMLECSDKSVSKLINVLHIAGCPLLGTELHMPVFRRDSETVGLLLRMQCPFDVMLTHGNRVGTGPAKGETPLTVACKMSTRDLVADLQKTTTRTVAKQREKIVRSLLAAGANPNQVNARGENPLSLAIKNQAGTIVSLLRKSGAKL